uniref:Uncharacterized protein n=1 Tax=Rhizophora mucronata TaxID=61149 RepID=A0A2P2JJH9_RHIMU
MQTGQEVQMTENQLVAVASTWVQSVLHG